MNKTTPESTPISPSELRCALDYIILKIDESIDDFTDKFPSASSVNGRYQIEENNDWTNGFWTGMLWLAYEYTGDHKYRKVAQIQCADFEDRFEKQIKLEHHDLGFLYSLSSVAGYKLTGNESMKKLALRVADKLLTRYKPNGGFIQAWGDLNDPASNRLIIDCLLNVPLLYWAAEVSGDKRYYDAALTHSKTTADVIVRENNSTYHTYYFDYTTGNPLRGCTQQGYSDSSCWARGQAWGIYGFPLSYRYTKDEQFLSKGVAVTDYFIKNLPQDSVCYWDLEFTDGSNEPKDSSAAAIAVCGMLELMKYTSSDLKAFYQKTANTILKSLIADYTTVNAVHSNGILLHGVYAKPQRIGVDECNIWGDYYYMEALIRLYKDWKPYW